MIVERPGFLRGAWSRYFGRFAFEAVRLRPPNKKGQRMRVSKGILVNLRRYYCAMTLTMESAAPLLTLFTT